ncbi:MAG: PilN domain-containing protein [Pantoea sp.]|uniref:PilN domain-containing protein n=1 Tax=Pantoea TaxID=53335 RepID=UPI0028B09A10|nr:MULTISPECIES: PilN domain-containing protein [Pantoea]MDU1575665.1 PilN domain-containing protein [Pantoea sp.]
MIAVNMLPWRHARLRRQRRAVLGLTATLLLALVLTAALALWRLDCVSQHLLRAQSEARETLTAIAQRISQRRELQQQLTAQQATWRRARRHADDLMRWHRFWQALPALMPQRVWLERVEKMPTQLRIEGRAQEMRAIGELRRRLDEAALFAAVRQGNVERQPDGVYRFTLRAHLEEIADE